MFHGSEPGLNTGESKLLGDTISVLWVSLEEVLDGPLLNLPGDILHVAGNIVDHVLPHGRVNDLSEQNTRLLEVAVGVVGSVPTHQTGDSVRRVPGVLREAEHLEAVGEVVLLLAFN